MKWSKDHTSTVVNVSRTKRLAFFPRGQFCYSGAPDHQAMLPSRCPEEGLGGEMGTLIFGRVMANKEAKFAKANLC